MHIISLRNVRQSLLLIVGWLLLSCSNISYKSYSKAGETSITPALMKHYISYLASDSMKGRNTPGPELDSAASFISAEFKRFGLKPLNGSFKQNFNICVTDLGDNNVFYIEHNGVQTNFKIKDDFVPFEISSGSSCEGQLVFAGYGITAAEYNYDDYKCLDARGKIVIVFRHEPGQNDTLSVFKGADDTKYSNLKFKMANAIKHGAIGMLVITEPLNYNSIRPRGFPWPSLSKIIPREALPLNLCDEKEESIPVIHAGEAFVNAVFTSVDSLKQIQKNLDKVLENKYSDLSSFYVFLKTNILRIQKPTQNVAGLLPGSDSVLRNETLVIGGHYDHVGVKKDHKVGEDYIFNGADDNASGTSVVLAVAAAFSKMPLKPERSILFIAFAGEEKGLFGSKAYTNNPLLPLKNTVAMLNLDMVGRNSTDSLCLIGNRQSPDIASIVRTENKAEPFTLFYEKENLLGGSDHYNFYQCGIPFIFFFSGFHSDYHKVSDNPDKINFDKTAKVARLVLRVAWHIANQDKHYKIIRK